MITFLRLLWRFRWQVIAGVLLSTVLAQHLLTRYRHQEHSTLQTPRNHGAVDYLRVDQVHPTDSEGDKLPQSILECIDLVYYSEDNEDQTQHQENLDYQGQSTNNVSDSEYTLDPLQAQLLNERYPDRPLLARTKIEVDDIILGADTRLDPSTGKVDTSVTELDRRKVWFPHDVLLGPEISIDSVGEKIGLNLEYRPGQVGRVHLRCDGKLFQYQNIDDSLHEDLIEHFDGVSYEVSCAVLYKIH